MDESKGSVTLGGVELHRKESHWADLTAPDGKRPREYWSARVGDRSFHLEREGRFWRAGVYGPDGRAIEAESRLDDRQVDAAAAEIFARHAQER